MKHHKLFILSVISIAVILGVYFAYPSFASTITVVTLESEGRNVTCYLQWHGRDQTSLELVTLADLGRSNHEYNKIVNNGEIFSVPIVANYSWVEISFLGKTLSLHSDGTNAILTAIGYT